MGTIELVAQDRARIDTLIELMRGETGEVLVSCNEAARLLGRNPSTISEIIREKRLEKVTIGRSTGIRLSEIKRLINRREAQEP